MNISYSDPLSRAYYRMKKALFQPFNLSIWFTIGFTAFLAALLDGGGSGGGGNWNNRYDHRNFDEIMDTFFDFPRLFSDWIDMHPILFMVIIVGIVFMFVLGIVLTWVSSRGKFMFIDNVVHNKAEVVNPWHNYRSEGNSLFIWRLVFGFISMVVFIIFASAFFMTIRDMYYETGSITEHIFAIMGMVLSFLVFFLLVSIISLFLNDFVVPLMYKNRISASQAWIKFLQVLSRNIGHFIVYVLFIFVLTIAVVIGVIIFGFVTLCIGFILLILPYIGSVLLLPVSYTYRAFSIEFLEQFGEDYRIFPETENNEVSSGF